MRIYTSKYRHNIYTYRYIDIFIYFLVPTWISKTKSGVDFFSFVHSYRTLAIYYLVVIMAGALRPWSTFTGFSDFIQLWCRFLPLPLVSSVYSAHLMYSMVIRHYM